MKSAAFLPIDNIDCHVVEKRSGYGQCLEKLSGCDVNSKIEVEKCSSCPHLKKNFAFFASFVIKIKKHVFMPKVA